MRQLKPDEARGKLKEYYWDSFDWIAEKKWDGVRFLMHIEKDKCRFTSRTKSKKDGLYVEKTDNFPHLQYLKDIGREGTVLDGEIIKGKDVYEVTPITGSSPEKAIARQKETGWVHFMVFDILFYKGEDVRDKPWYERHKLLKKVIPITPRRPINKDFIHISSVYDNKISLWADAMRNGEEGIMLKNRHDVYGKRKWVKVKRMETWDVYITGYQAPKENTVKSDGTISVSKYWDKGYIGALEFKTIEGNGHGTCSGLDDIQRALISAEPDRYIGKAFEIAAQEKLPSGAFRHPRFIRWREDKDEV